MDRNMASYFKLLADDTRLRIIELLLKGETCGCTLIDQLPIAQPTLSYHLKMLSLGGLASARREGNWIKYSIDRTRIDDMIDYLESLKRLDHSSCTTRFKQGEARQ
ncbi:MAG: ArsR/SmtB family transcription factor [Acholeplasmataceae bacterium]